MPSRVLNGDNFLLFVGNLALFFSLRVASRLSKTISRLIKGWYNYVYDGYNQYEIRDGGYGMYDNGNRVTALLSVLMCVRQSRCE